MVSLREVERPTAGPEQSRVLTVLVEFCMLPDEIVPNG